MDLLAESDLYHGLFQHIRCIEFEGRKYFTRICEYSISQRSELLEPYVESRPLFLEQLVASYDEKDVSVALCGDAILRACLMRESICETWFNHKPSLVQPFFKYVELPNFDISAHAFETLKVHYTALYDMCELSSVCALLHADGVCSAGRAAAVPLCLLCSADADVPSHPRFQLLAGELCGGEMGWSAAH